MNSVDCEYHSCVLFAWCMLSDSYSVHIIHLPFYSSRQEKHGPNETIAR